MRIGVFTISSKNYLSYVRTLFSSIVQVHPEYRRYLCLADEVDGYFDPSKEEFEVIQADNIGIATFRDMSVRYDIMEFNTAVKPFMIGWLFDNTDLDVVIYLDPDIRVFSRFDALESEIRDGASVVLTPHITQPLEDGLQPNDYHMLQAGVFNLGFIAVQRCDEAIRFIQWWGRRLTTHCASDISRSLFTDQKWCDLAPCFLDRLKVFKDPGYNIAYWNLAQRQVTTSTNGQWLVEGKPLAFFHFSGVSADRKQLVSKHQNRFKWNDIESCQSLFETYLDALIAAGWNISKHWPYAYSDASSGFKIASVIRQLYREENPNPVPLGGLDLGRYLVELCNQVVKDVSVESGIVITHLMALVYRLRPDLQAAFSLATRDGCRSFAHWFEITGNREYGLPPEVTRQDMILGLASPLSLKKQIVGATYWTITSLEKSARKLSVYLPSNLRDKGRVTWRQAKNRLSRLL
jgi:hypothetical protein